MANCFENVAHEAINNCPNDENSSGISTRLFYAPTEFFKKTTLPTTVTTYVSKVTIAADGIEFNEEKGWKGIDVQINENELKSTLVGNQGNKKAKAELDFYIPGFRSEVLGFLDMYKNIPMVFAVRDSNGVFWILGNKINPAYIETADGTTGKQYEDNSGVAVKVSANSKLYKFAGEIAETK